MCQNFFGTLDDFPLGVYSRFLQNDHIFGKNNAFDLTAKAKNAGKKVVVLGGMVGCESGLYLAQKGHEVTIVEKNDTVAPDSNPRHRPALMKQLAQHATIRTGLTGKAVTEEGLLCEDKDGNELLLEADTILSASGLRPLAEVVDSLSGTAPIVEVVGDCVKPDVIRGAAFRAYHAALDL